MELKLREMAQILNTSIKGPLANKLASRKVTLCTDSRSIRKGQVFWALRGDRFDGHEYTEACLEQGALAAVVDRSWYHKEAREQLTCIPVKDSTRSLLTLARVYGQKFSIPKITLTGSNGKTTVKDMLMAVLRRRGKVLGTRGNLNNHIGVPLTLFGLNSSHKFAVIELGTNHPGEIRVLAETVGADAGIITNIGHGHTQFFGSPAGVFREKRTITTGFSSDAVLVINEDDPYLKKLAYSDKYRVLTFGIHQGQVRAEDLSFTAGGCGAFRVGRTRFRLRVPGEHMVYNALAAIALCTHLKVPKKVTAAALGTFKTTGRRMEVKKHRGITIYDDCYNANPPSMKAALRILGNSGVKGRTYAVLGDMGELGTEEKQLHREVGETLAECGIDEFFGLGILAREIGAGARAAGMDWSRVHIHAVMEQLQKQLAQKLQPGDAVLVKGSRFMRMEKVTDFLMEKSK